MTPPAVKICGLTSVDDARVAVDAGADYLGAILSPGFSRSVPPEVAGEFVALEGPPVVAVVVDVQMAAAARMATLSGARVIQLHGEESPEYVRALRDHGPWRLWKAQRVRSTSDISRALERYGPYVDGLLLEGWHAERGGGVGAGFSWDLIAPIRASIPVDITLVAAGGLAPDNVRDAVARLDPDVVDVSSGVELRLGVKDPDKVRAFVRNARAGWGS